MNYLNIKFTQRKIMKILFTLCLLSFISASFSQNTKSLYDFTMKTIDGQDFKMSELKGKKVLIVNTASECGYTPQYQDLEALYKKYKANNFVILGFPCNDFGGQEPGENAQIKGFCEKNYGVSFQLMDKISTKGKSISPLYSWLCNKTENGVLDATVKWNFNKFLIDENGILVKHLGSSVNPLDAEIVNWIEGK